MVWGQDSIHYTLQWKGRGELPRRGENIRKRKDGRWEARYPSGQNEKGKKIYSSVYGNTYREAKEKRQLAVQQNSLPVSPKDGKVFKDVLWLWLEDNRIRLKDATIYRYSYLIENHILPQLGDMRVDQITGTAINCFLAEKLKCGRLDGKSSLSPAYVRSIMLIVSAAMRYAAENEICAPLRTQVNKPPVQSKEPVILSRELQAKLEKNLLYDLDGTKIGVYISLYTGLRIGEICALTWDDIDLQNRLLYVRHTVVRIRAEEKGKVCTRQVIDRPKTKASLRCIPICSNLQNVLVAYAEHSPSKYVVSNNSQFVCPRTYEYRYNKLLELSEVPHVNYHSLRHTFATRCIESGVDVKSLSEILGHANVSITLNTYVHSSMDLKRAQLEKLTVSPI